MSRINLKGTGYVRVFCDNPNCEESIDIYKGAFANISDYLVHIYNWEVVRSRLKRYDFCCDKCLNRSQRLLARY